MKMLALAITSILLTGCAAQQQAEHVRNAEEQILRKKLETSQLAAWVKCQNKSSCDKAFALTKVYVQQHSDMKVQSSDETLVSTFNPTRSGDIGINAIKVPDAGQTSIIQLAVRCKSIEYRYVLDVCGNRVAMILDGFKPFVESRLE